MTALRSPHPRVPAKDAADAPRVRVSAFLCFGDRILLVRQRRDAERHTAGYWLLPGGGVRFGERLADALRRELREELGISASPINPIALVESVSDDLHYAKHVIHVIMHVPWPPHLSPHACQISDPAIKEARLWSAAELGALDIRPPLTPELTRWLHTTPHGMEYLGVRW